MRYKWKLHPSDYLLGENEKFYTDMESKGWQLVERGAHWSKFQRTEPSRARYRVEVATPAFLDPDGGALPEEQIAVYEDCGWEHVTSRGMLHFFRAPAGSDAPEFYQDPRQQAETLKGIRRRLLWSWVVSAVLVALLVPPIVTFGGGTASFLARLRRAWVLSPGIPGCYCLFILWGVAVSIIDAWQIGRTYRRLKKGIPLDHEPRSCGLGRLVLDRGLWAGAILCLVLTVAQLVTVERGDLPERPDGPYIVLSDIGWDDARTESFGNTSRRTHTRTFLSEYWETREYVEDPEGDMPVTIYQNVYRMSHWIDPMDYARDLAAQATFVDDFAGYTPVEIDGLDAAWLVEGGMEILAVKGDLVAYATYLDDGTHNTDRLLGVLEALAQRWIT